MKFIRGLLNNKSAPEPCVVPSLNHMPGETLKILCRACVAGVGGRKSASRCHGYLFAGLWLFFVGVACAGF
jgi:hypothetical protein